MVDVSTEDLVKACTECLARDPVANVLTLGDLYSPLREVSDVYAVVDGNDVAGVCSIYRAYPNPALVFSSCSLEAKHALVREALAHIARDFVSLCSPNDADILRKYAAVLRLHQEYQYVVKSPKYVECGNVSVTRVREDDLGLLNRFYVEQHAEAWVPIQFKAGPYYCVKQNGNVVSAAGVHLATPYVAQLGNIVTHKAYRNRGLGTACTSRLAVDLASGGRIVSLFVRADNAPAIRMYERLGFSKARDVEFLVMRKKAL